MTRHLDLGCGPVPRNPDQRDELFGVDLSGSAEGGPIRKANLVMQAIAFAEMGFEVIQGLRPTIGRPVAAAAVGALC